MNGPEGNPLAAGLVAFGLGALAASLIPLSRMESDQKQLLQQQVVDPLSDQLGLGETGRGGRSA